jgi:hypothetical protein
VGFHLREFAQKNNPRVVIRGLSLFDKEGSLTVALKCHRREEKLEG